MDKYLVKKFERINEIVSNNEKSINNMVKTLNECNLRLRIIKEQIELMCLLINKDKE